MSTPFRTEDFDEVVVAQGQYWKALKAFPFMMIKEGMVLLLQSIRDVDKTAHTIILRPHPSVIGKSFRVSYTKEDGEDSWRSTGTLNEHRFLIADFLKDFVLEPNFSHIRQLEVAEIQLRLGQLQEELGKPQEESPSFQKQLTAGVKEWEAKQEWGDVTPSAVSSTQMVPLSVNITPAQVEEMKLAIAYKAEVAKIKASYIKEQVKKIGETVDEMVPFFQEQAAAALAQTEDVQTFVTKLQKGIQSLDLYVGTGVKVTEITKGQSAPEDEPLTIMQQKLFADEELSVYADVGESFDHTHSDKFFAALAQHPKLVAQMFSAQRCIVAYALTNRDLKYGNAYENMVRNAENHKVGILVRDGENLYAVHSPIDSHLSAHNLFPGRAELDALFMSNRGWGKDPREITFMDVEYTDKLSDHEAYALHYKRFLILMAGLDHRLNLFGSFYSGPKSMDFITPGFQERHIRFIHDDDMEGMLPAPKTQTLHDWIQGKNSYLRSGSRVMVWGRQVANSKTSPGAMQRDRDGSHGLKVTFKQESMVLIARREGKEIVVGYPVQASTWNDSREFDVRMSLTQYHDHAVGYLVLDAVHSSEIERYIHDRHARKNFLRYIKFFKMAAAYLRDEEKHEAPARGALKQALADGGIATGTEADRIISKAVIAYRADHRGAPLPFNVMGKWEEGYSALLNQMHTQVNADRYVDAVLKFAADAGLTPLRLVVTGKSRLSLYCAPLSSERDDRLAPHAWVHVITLEQKKTGVKEVSRRWTLLPKQSASETTLMEWPEAEAWTVMKSSISYGLKQEIFDRANAFHSRWTEINSTDPKELMKEWMQVRSEMNRTSSYVHEPALVIPFGVLYNPREDRWSFLAISCSDAVGFLASLPMSDEDRETLKRSYVSQYRNKTHAAETFGSNVSELKWELAEAPTESLETELFQRGSFRSPGSSRDRNTESLNLHLNACLHYWAKKDNYYRAEVYTVSVDLDNLLGVDTRRIRFRVETTEFGTYGEDHVRKEVITFLTIRPTDAEDGTTPYDIDAEEAVFQKIGNYSRRSSDVGRFYTLEDARALVAKKGFVKDLARVDLQPVSPLVERYFKPDVPEEETD